MSSNLLDSLSLFSTNTTPFTSRIDLVIEETAISDDIDEFQQEIRDTLADISEEAADDQLDFAAVYKTAEGALAPSTLRGYEGQIRKFQSFIETFAPNYQKIIDTPSEETPVLICLWILHVCGEPDVTAKDQILREAQGKSYGHAEKMRAALSYFFAHTLRRGSERFSEKANGTWSGNPVLCDLISRNMRSLKRKKTRAGEIHESVRAITARQLSELYQVNSAFPFKSSLSRIPTIDGVRPWGGGRQRLMMSLMYAIAFICLLRFDEVLRIELRHLRLHDLAFGKIELVLDFRKTAQAGGELPLFLCDIAKVKPDFSEIQPFFLYFNRREPWLDIPTLLFEWLHQSGIKSGYLFRGFTAADLPKIEGNVKCASGVVLQNFRFNMVDIGEDPYLYGTHSFRRGGVQYFTSEKRWDLRKICGWGGWSSDFDSFTIVRYLIGVNDFPVKPRENYLNPRAQIGELCGYCGRTCDCA